MPARAAANRDFVSTFYRIGRRVEFMRTGDRYCNYRAGRLADVAHVTRLSTDAAGIMHVHFDLTVYCLDRRDPVGHRSLALAAFLGQFDARYAPDDAGSVRRSDPSREAAAAYDGFAGTPAEAPGLG